MPLTEDEQKVLTAARETIAKGAQLEKTLVEVQATCTELKAKVAGFGDISAKDVQTKIEEIKATVDTFKKRMRNNASAAGYIAGLEDEKETKKFSFLKTYKAVRLRDWETTDAGYEKEICAKAMEVAKSQGINTTVDGSAGAFVPDQVLADIVGPIYALSVLIALGNQGTTRVRFIDGLTGGEVRLPKFDGGIIPYWVGEKVPIPESDIAGSGNLKMTPRKLAALTRLTAEMVQMASPALDQLIRTDMITKLALEIDRIIPYGTGGDFQPRGIASNPAVYRAYAEFNGRTAADFGSNPTGIGGTLGFDGLMNIMGVLEDNNIPLDPSFAFVASPMYWRGLKQSKVAYYSGQSTQQSYLVGMPMLSDQKLRDLIGDFSKMTQIPNNLKANQSIGGTNTGNGSLTKFSDVFAANWSNVLFGRWSGMMIEDDGGKGVGFNSEQTYMRARMMVDVGFRQEKCVVHVPDVQVKP